MRLEALLEALFEALFEALLEALFPGFDSLVRFELNVLFFSCGFQVLECGV